MTSLQTRLLATGVIGAVFIFVIPLILIGPASVGRFLHNLPHSGWRGFAMLGLLGVIYIGVALMQWGLRRLRRR